MSSDPDYVREILGSDYEALKQETTTRLFLGIPIPDVVSDKLLEVAQRGFPQYVERYVPKENLHMTLFFLGEVKNHAQFLNRLAEPLTLTFVTTASVAYIGRGKQRDQLWSYITPTPNLEALRGEVRERLRAIRFPLPAEDRAFVPHIKLGEFFPMARSLGMADMPAVSSFQIKEVCLYKSTLVEGKTPSYSVEAIIPL